MVKSDLKLIVKVGRIFVRSSLLLPILISATPQMQGLVGITSIITAAGRNRQLPIASNVSFYIRTSLRRCGSVHRFTFSANSLCHFFGRRGFKTKDYSTNLF